MSLKEIKKDIEKDFNEGEKKSVLFKKYKDKDVKENKKIKDVQLATIISTLKDPELMKKHKVANNILITIMTILLILTILGQVAAEAPILLIVLLMIIPLLLIKGFVNNNYMAYNAYIILSMLNFSNILKAIKAEPAVGMIALVISISLFVFVWKLKSKLFPNMGFFGAKKNKNKEYLITETNED
jgi:phosphoglycerol transferase MdoB-like AlkP superfamily enzyme